MADSRDPPYDPYIPSGGAGGQQGGQGQNGNHRTAALQAVRYSLSSAIEQSTVSAIAGRCSEAASRNRGAGAELAETWHQQQCDNDDAGRILDSACWNARLPLDLHMLLQNSAA